MVMRLNLYPPSHWQGYMNCCLEVMSEWIGVRMEQEREEGKMDLYLLGKSKCYNAPPSLVIFKGRCPPSPSGLSWCSIKKASHPGEGLPRS